MKKYFLVCLGTVGGMMALSQEANAWINFKFGVGLNWNWQSGGNNLLWGAFQNGQPGGFEGYNPWHHHSQPGFGYPSFHAPIPAPAPMPSKGPSDGKTDSSSLPQSFYIPSPWDNRPHFRPVLWDGRSPAAPFVPFEPFWFGQ